MSDADVVIIIPILSRSHRVRPVVESIRATCDARIIFGITPGDSLVENVVDDMGIEFVRVPWAPKGDYARKINACFRLTTEPWIFCGADDLSFHPGWLDNALAMADSGTGVIGTNDMGNPRVVAGEHSTHSFVARWYANEGATADDDAPLTVLHEAYPHEYVDDELVGVAKRRGVWRFAADSLVEHLHPNWGKGIPDALYEAQHVRMRQGAALYRSRAKRWM